MTLLKKSQLGPYRCSSIVLMSAMFVVGCSGSGSGKSSSTESETANAAIAANDSLSPNPGAENDSATELSSTSGESVLTETDADADSQNTISSSDESANEITNNPSIDTLAPITTRTTFEITVPVYVSSALQVHLEWGDIALKAKWVIDESWSITTELPVDTENPLIVTFSDNNGDLVLASVETVFKTSTAPSGVFTIAADQFDTERWDNDGDGVSNLSELLNGDDPLLALNDNVEIRDLFVANLDTWHIDVEDIESRIPAERPYFEDTSLLIPASSFEEGEPNPDNIGENYRTTINLDEFGTGTFFYQLRDQFSPSYFESYTYEATRTNTGDSILLDISANRFHVEARIRYSNTISTETTLTDERHYFQTGLVDGLNTYDNFSGQFKFISYGLTGKIIPDSANCEAIAGYLEVKERPHTEQVRSIYTVKKEISDDYWTLSVTDLDGQPRGEDSVLYRKLSVPFYCGFPELR